MKATKFNKKLFLNKLTVSNLNLDSMKELKGGGVTDTKTRLSCAPWVCAETKQWTCTGSGCCPFTDNTNCPGCHSKPVC